MSDKIRLTGLWLQRSKRGYEYLTGDISPSSRLLVLKNNRKVVETDPDFVAYITAPGQRDEAQEEPEQPELINHWTDKY